MAEGLVQQAQAAAPPAAAPPAAAPMPGEQVPVEGMPAAAPPAEGEAASPEEQEAYDSAMQMASELLHVNDESSEQIMKMLSEGEPVESVVKVVDFIIGQIEETFKNQLPETVIIPAADEITDLVIELGDESGAFDITEEQIMQAKGSVVRSLLETYGIEPEDLEGMMAGVDEEELANYAQMFGGQA